MKKIAVINDLSGFGRCSLSVALPILSVMGHECCPIPTAILSNQTGYDDFHFVDFTEHLTPYVDVWKKQNAEFDAILTGYLASEKQVDIILDFIDRFGKNSLVFVDPVMADDGEIYKCYDEESVKAIVSLAERADIITPNLTELCVLSSRKYDEVVSLRKEELLSEIEKMSALQSRDKAKIVVTSGIHISENEVANTIYEKGSFDVVITPHYGGSFSGTGDILASFVTAQYIKGVPVKKAVKQASEFICKSIEETIKDTDGNYCRMDGVHFEKYLRELGEL